jgi:hypothetical protein
MERLINSDSTVTQLWSPTTPKNPEYGGDVLRNVGSNYSHMIHSPRNHLSLLPA